MTFEVPKDVCNQWVVIHKREKWVAHIEGGQLKAIVNNELVVNRIIAHYEEKAERDSKKLAYVRAKSETASVRRNDRVKKKSKAKKKK